MLNSVEIGKTNMEKGRLASISRSNNLTEPILGMKFNPNCDSLLAVFTLKSVTVLQIHPKKATIDRIVNLELMFDQMGLNLTISEVYWVGKLNTNLAVVTNQFVKIYDVSKDLMAPVFTITVSQGDINCCSFKEEDDHIGGQKYEFTRIFVGSQDGKIFTHLINLEEPSADSDSLLLAETIEY